MNQLFFVVAVFFSILGYSQKKVLQTKFISESITIDGKLNEESWKSAAIATNFVMFQPDNGKPIPENQRTEVKVLYNNDAIYVAALLYDDEPRKILKEITPRDNFGAADFFGVFINGYNDGQQDFQFYVSASDGQGDCITTDESGEDYSWDAVWKSKAIITDFGWAVEMRIPYAALRFSSENKQTWGLNFFREIKRDRQKYSWNYIDSKIGTFTQQNGALEGIQNIKTPTRLFLLPYSSFYANGNANQKTYGTIKGGLDIKYGINDAFTLDAILVPDFGQTKYDDKILNLGPFEQKFNENRSFFTEGTDLFNKGNLLYSRRIGGQPSLGKRALKESLPTDLEVTEYPNSVNLMNAIKVSGRTKDGLGIGVLNAITENTYATIQNKTNGQTSRQLIEPLANYNVLVLDQRFRKNSSVSFINTNVTRNGSFRDANVSALAWNLNTKKNSYNLSGDFKYSYINEEQDKKGVSSSLFFDKTSGKIRFGFGSELVTKKYDNNDLGINFFTNYYSLMGRTGYRILNPTEHFNMFNAMALYFTQFNLETGHLQDNSLEFMINSINKKNNYLGLTLSSKPLEAYDYYEPRTANRFLITPSNIAGELRFSSNYNKKFALDLEYEFKAFNESSRNTNTFSIGPRYRFNDKLSFMHNFEFSKQNNNKGFIDSDENNQDLAPNTIVFANRNVVTYSNSLTGKYSINSQMNFNIALRHYWSYAENKNFLTLEQNGRLADYAAYTKNKNSNFNSWNFDLSYSWWFAPGSQVSVLYRNNAANFGENINKNFKRNVTDLLNNDNLSNVFSISIKYFIDYNVVKNII
jgi:hypothetical protein